MLLDFGYAAALAEPARTAFAGLFLTIAPADARLATEVVVGTAAVVPDGLDERALERDVAALLDGATRTTPEEFQVAGFVTRLFAVQRRHRVVAAPDVTTATMALLSYEGLLETYLGSVDFQREALPKLLGAGR